MVLETWRKRTGQGKKLVHRSGKQEGDKKKPGTKKSRDRSLKEDKEISNYKYQKVEDPRG